MYLVVLASYEEIKYKGHMVNLISLHAEQTSQEKYSTIRLLGESFDTFQLPTLQHFSKFNSIKANAIWNHRLTLKVEPICII